ncbi:hypothetical protein CEXT_527731 [Caerostris extrusa]|uniref:Uncharacterized protein n=1 Tax=Caerostris extrusa TaxID=172846 RepID=A0AAV4UF70_CAEEX|nr:hypothetical protein CEXT_527731 [Caerostris extrusa]
MFAGEETVFRKDLRIWCQWQNVVSSVMSLTCGQCLCVTGEHAISQPNHPEMQALWLPAQRPDVKKANTTEDCWPVFTIVNQATEISCYAGSNHVCPMTKMFRAQSRLISVSLTWLSAQWRGYDKRGVSAFGLFNYQLPSAQSGGLGQIFTQAACSCILSRAAPLWQPKLGIELPRFSI